MLSPSGGNIAEVLANRKELLEGQMRLHDTNVEPASYTQGRTNAFCRVKTRVTGSCSWESFNKNNLKPAARGWGPLRATPLFPAYAPVKPPLSSSSFEGVVMKPDLATTQEFASQKFYSIDPFKQQVGIGETVLEIVSGNIPKITSNFYNLMKSTDFLNVLKKSPKAASQDFLNANFGLGPIFGDLYNLLVKGVTLHEALYNQSYRRRRWGRPFSESKFVSKTDTAPCGLFVYNSSGNIDQFTIVPAGKGSSVSKDLSVFQRYDQKFTARFTLARATSSAETFYDKALTLLRTYGVWTPSLLWDITPWSWLIDWFFHIGRGFTLAYDYGKDGGVRSDYACVTSRTTITVDIPGMSKVSSTSTLTRRFRSSHYLSVSDTIIRNPVNPFGTLAPLAQLSGWQKAILISLGIAKFK